MAELPLITLHDGRKLDPATGKLVRETADEAPVARREPRQVVSRQLSDLSVSPRQMNSIAVVAAYALWGLDNDSIAQAVGVEPRQIVALRESELYRGFSAEIMRAIFEGELADLRDSIATKAHRALKRVDSLLDDEDTSSNVKLKAAQDILDRAGFRATDIIEHRHKIEGGIQIVYVDDTKAKIDLAKEIDFTEVVDNGDGS